MANFRQLLRHCRRPVSRRDYSVRHTPDTCFITTPIFYVNASPHLGHLYTSVIADAAFRHRVDCGEISPKSSLPIFSTGTDEHGMKIQKAAKVQGVQVQHHCDKVSEQFRHMANLFSVSYTDFVRTTEERHYKAVKHFWTGLVDSDNIYKSEYEGWYCVADEAFVPESMLKDHVTGKGEKVKIVEESGHHVEWTKEENYIFRLKKFIPEVRKWVKTGPIKPSKFCDILLQYIDEGFDDLSVSRPRSRLDWGVPVPNDDSQVVYVWLDALINYLTVAGYPDKLTQWPPSLQVVGKDILKFHGVYWPAFLMAAGLEPPKEILCHSHWTVEGKKMSKSLGNVVDPFPLSEIYGRDALRYFLLREGTPHSDANFTEEKMRRQLNAELADTFGNLLSRCSGKVVNASQKWPEWDKGFNDVLSDCGKTLKDSLEALPEKVEVAYKEYCFYRGLEHIMATTRTANLFVDETKPWLLAKQDGKSPVLLSMLSLVFETLRVTSLLTKPVIPNLSSTVLDRLNISSEDRRWSNIKPFIWEEREDKEQPFRNLGGNEAVFYKRVKL